MRSNVVIREKSHEKNEVEVDFMYPDVPAKYFSWPQRKDFCWIPVENIILTLLPPSANQSGRNYFFEGEEDSYKFELFILGHFHYFVKIPPILVVMG